MLPKSVFLSLIAIILSGCTVEQVLYVPPEDPNIAVHPSWNYGSQAYDIYFSVDEDYYQNVQDTPRPSPSEDFGELVDLAFGSGLPVVEELADDLYEESPYNDSACREIEFVIAYIRSLSYGSSFIYDESLGYPLEVAVDGGTNSADLTALAGAVLNHLNYDVGIAVFYNPCCDDDIHVALAVADYYSFYHGRDNLGTEWVFLETLASDANNDLHERPDWMRDYRNWLVWPLWEHSDQKTTPRKVVQTAEDVQVNS